jgi:2-polyprenyl-6-methoxyphenol hydroxylase-like FAD-dependent oxidoreductase
VPDSDRVIIIGAGIAGLTAGIALRRVGIDATVYEASDEVREIGSGLGVQYGAMKALRLIGLEDKVREIGEPLTQMVWTAWNGKPLATIPHLPLKEKLGAQTHNVHRGEFVSLLVSELGRDKIEVGARFDGFEEDADGVTVRFEGGRTERGAVLVGADGSRSRVRSHSLGQGDPRPTNVVVWRAMPDFEHPLLPIGVLRQVYGPGTMFAMIPGTRKRVFWFAAGLVAEFGRQPATGVKEEALATWGHWMEPIPELLRATAESQISRTLIFDRPPADHWGTGRVTLAGDAAHPMAPTLGQGASTGIEDGVALAYYLAEAGSLADGNAVQLALQAYETERIARTTPLVQFAHRFAPIVHAKNPVTVRLRDLFFRSTSDAAWQRRMLGQHTYDPKWPARQ